MSHTITLRPGRPDDVAACGTICFEAFSSLNARHNFPPDFPAPEMAGGLMQMLLNSPHIYSVVAEADGRVVGSNFLWIDGPVGGVGPITVDPNTQQRSVGRMLMENVMAHAAGKSLPSVRLVQAAFNTTSMSLYTKLGFDIREPLVCLQGKPPRVTIPGYAARKATAEDMPACNDVCRRVHGHDRAGDLASAVQRGTALVVERRGGATGDGQIAGYASDVGFFGHIVALDNAALMALIAAAEAISGPGMLLPSRNGEVFRWCLANGLRMVQPMTLMSHGLYNEPRGAFVPSILY